ncbi:hypothetical protein F2Q69_00042973 [Brassica cretica]|uniref:Acyl-CoA dehydrogenase/oxidase N-terminal domain-containing protein n=1 Tax=Brassica cretica TaxID=69181 RepID=A0A8S9NCS0_BRACR|nr:hypothetical protein F2Q69_00042973 [Brassica cretica]
MIVLLSTDRDNAEKKVKSSYFDFPAMNVSVAFPQKTPASKFPPCNFGGAGCAEESEGVHGERSYPHYDREFPFYIIPKLGALGVVRGSIKGYGCPGLSITANAIATAEISRVDGSCGTFNLVHTYLGMLSIGKMSLAWRRFHPKTD